MAVGTLAREALLNFLDEQVFLPALNADPEDYSVPERKILVRVKDGVAGTRLKYREDYSSAERIRANFNSDLASPFGHNLAANMFLLGLPRFEDVKADFLDLCRRHGLEDDL